MFDEVEIGTPAAGAIASGVERGADVIYVPAVERSEGPHRRGEDLGWESNFGLGRCERDDPARNSFVECDGETLFDIAFPKEFEDLVGVRRKCESGGGGGAVLIHDPFVLNHLDGIMFLDSVNEDLANSLQLVLPR